MRTVRLLITAVCVSLLGVAEASAQRVQGLVHDSLTRGGIPGAVLVELDADGRTLARHLSDAEGRYAFALRAGAHTVRIQRIGFRPRTIEVALLRRRADVAMARLPWFLVPTRVVAKGCSERPDDGIAAALLDQARTGLLAAVVSREQAAAAMVILTFERRLGRNGTFDSQRVRIDSGRALRESFTTGPTGADLVEFGFLEAGDDESVLHAPDIDVLLDDAFVRAYCFRLAKPQSGRESQVGLSFSPAKRKRDRVDIEGTVWVDTVARALRDIEFRYVGLHRELQAFDPGGHIGLAAMTNGMVLIDRWSLRLVGVTQDTVRSPAAIRNPRPVVRNLFHLSESGGELAAARWADGHAYAAALGGLRVRAVDSTGGPAVGLEVRLADTDYRATVDSTGMAAIARLLPGPYSLVVEDPELAPIGMVLQTGVGFHANRDSVHTASFDVPTASSFMGERCGAPRHLGQEVVPRILGRVIMSDGGLVEPGEIHVAREVSLGEWEPIDKFFHVESDGIFWICPTNLLKNTEVRVQYHVKKELKAEMQVPLRSDVVIVPVLVDR